MRKPVISVIIPIKTLTAYLDETLTALLGQDYPNFEIILVPDRSCAKRFAKTKIVPSWPVTGPAGKRNLGAKFAHGTYLAFLDDDSYPARSWLSSAVKLFSKLEPAGLCGPTLTPATDGLAQQASGWVWSTWLGSGGAGTYRCVRTSARYVADFPSVNLLINRTDFLKLGGFDTRFWPGEDTKLCYDLVYRLHKKLYYHPSLVVYHHRRPVFKSHLRQISRYALHRGYFARKFPRTSLTLGYLAPSILVCLLVLAPFLLVLTWLAGPVYLSLLALYFGLATYTGSLIYTTTHNLKLSLLSLLAILATHLVYGMYFIRGFLKPTLEDQL